MNGKIILGVLAVAAGAVAYKCWKDGKQIHNGKLVKKTWERTVHVQEFKETTEKGKVVPDGAEVIGRSTKTNINAQNVLNNINFNTRTGRVSLPEIRTETIYTYKVKKWVTISTRTVSGIDSVPHDPEIELVNPFKNGTPELGQQRTLFGSEKRSFIFADEEGLWHEVAATSDDYRTLNAGDKVLFKKVCGAYKIVGAEAAEKEVADDGKLEKAEQGVVSKDITPVSEPIDTDISEGSDE